MDKQLAKVIGTTARNTRKALELTQEDAAERIGVSAEFYARIERGNALPSVPTLAHISAALGVSADRLLGLRRDKLGDGHPPSSATPPGDTPEIRRLLRRLRKATPETVRLVTLLARELERLSTSDD